MKRNIIPLFTVMTLLHPSISLASSQNDNYTIKNTQKIAIVQDIMKDVVKRTLYGIGNEMLNRYINPNGIYYNNQYYNNQNNNGGVNYNTNTNQNSVQFNPSNPDSTNYNNTAPNQTDYVPGYENEQMIPVS